MKKLVTLLLLCTMFYVGSTFAQKLQFASVSLNGKNLANIPRYSWDLPLNTKIWSITNNIMLHGGATIKNEGVIFNQGNDKRKLRSISIGPNANFVFNIKKIRLIAGYGLDYNMHYKEKLFIDKSRNQKSIVVKEWFSSRVPVFNHYARFGIGMTKGAYLYGEYFFKNFINSNFEETDNQGVVTQPYKGLEIQRFNIGFGYIISMMDKD